MAESSQSRPRKILLVDDDAFVLKIYGDSLARHGFQIETAADGVEALKALRTGKPDLLVLDLMMPRLNGVEVLKFIRAQTDLAALPVIVLSNAYLDNLGWEAATVGAQKALLKAGCSPTILIGAINELLDGQASTLDASQLLAVTNSPAPAASGRPAPSSGPPPGAVERRLDPRPAPVRPASGVVRAGPDPKAEARTEFLKQGSAAGAEVRSFFEAYARALTEEERQASLQRFYGRVQTLAATASQVEASHVARLAGALEALLFELTTRSSRYSASTLRTVTAAVEFLPVLFQRAGQGYSPDPPRAQALLLNTDPLANLLAATALRQVQVQSQSFVDPPAGLAWLRDHACDLVLLNVDIPGLDGFQLRDQLRGMPGRGGTAVIFLTRQADFENRAKPRLTPGDDFATKPFFPPELALQAVLLLLKQRLAFQ